MPISLFAVAMGLPAAVRRKGDSPVPGAPGLGEPLAEHDAITGVVATEPGQAAPDSSAGDDGRVFVTRTAPERERQTQSDENDSSWGFADTHFTRQGDAVVLTGSRYGLCGQRLTQLIPWVEKTMGISVPQKPVVRSHYPAALPPSKIPAAFVDAVVAALGNDSLSTDSAVRMRCGHGHAQSEMYAVKYGQAGRMPDCVVHPDSERDVQLLVRLAHVHGVCLIPYGGGTNVTEALACPVEEKRPIAAVAMAKLDRIQWIDPVNQVARIEAGAIGRHLQQALAARGFILGHEPDSIEFSTLGGWIATNASGMKKNKYGNIEDIVLDMNIVTAHGIVGAGAVTPRQSVGFAAQQCLFGSEGTLGIITSAIVKLVPIPEETVYGSILFPNFAEGVAFMYAMTRAGLQPASVRLVDNVQFQLSMALKEPKEGFAKLKSRAEALFVTRYRGFRPNEMVACTLVFEGGRDEVQTQEKRVYALAKEFQGMRAGADNGARGYQLTYSIAYIRDFVMQYGILAESFETSLPWTGILELCERVKARIAREHAERGLPGRPLVTCRVTQVYGAGAAVYFYLATSFVGVDDPSEVYGAIEHAAREEVLAAGGSLSHHHGVGKLRRAFLPNVLDPASLAMRGAIKRALDPNNIFGAANASAGINP